MNRPRFLNQLRTRFDRILGKGPRRRQIQSLKHRSHRFEDLEQRQLLSVVPIGSEQIVNTTLLGNQTLADSGRALAALPDQGYTIVYGSQSTETGWDVLARRYAPDGTPQDPICVNSVLEGDQQRPSIATAPDGTSMVVYQGPDANLAGIYAQRLDAAGQPTGSAVQLNVTTQGEQQMPDVARLAGGGWIAVWSGRGVGDNSGVFGRLLSDDGTPLSSEFRVNSSTHSMQKLASVAATADGNFVVTWASYGGGDGIDVLAQRFDSAGQKLDSEFVVNSVTHSQQSYPCVAASPTGGFAIAWQSLLEDGSGEGVFFQRFDASGQKVGGETQASTTTLGDQRDPAVAYDAQGNFLVSWSRAGAGDNSGIFARQFSTTGEALTGEFLVNSFLLGTQSSPAIAAASSGYVLGWSGVGNLDIDGVYLRRFGSPPQSAGIADIAVWENAPAQSINLLDVFEDPENPDTQLAFAVTGNTNAELFSQVAIDSTGSLTLEFAPNRFGAAWITVEASDPGGLACETTFAVTVRPVDATLSPGVVYRYYTGAWTQLPDLQGLAPQAVGVASTIDLSMPNCGENFAVQFTGQLAVAQDGTYTFYTASDDGSRLWIDGQMVVNNDGIHPTEEQSGSVTLTAGMHAIRVDYFQGGGGGGLTVSWEGPGLVKQVIPADWLYHAGSVEPCFTASSVTAAAGRSANFTARLLDLTGSAPAVQSVAFYRDVNADGTLDAQDELLAVDTDGTDGFTAHVSAADWPAGPNLVLARFALSDGTSQVVATWTKETTAEALTLTWAGGDGTWDAQSAQWVDREGVPQPWQDGAAAIFTGTPGVVTISGLVAPRSLAFSVGGYTLTAAGPAAENGITTSGDGLVIEVWDLFAPETTLSATIRGSGNLTKTGSGMLVLAAPNTYTGNTLLVGGRTRLGADDALPTTVLQLGDPGWFAAALDLGGHNLSLAGLCTGQESYSHRPAQNEIYNDSPTAAKLTVANTADFAYAGRFRGNLAIDKLGSGRWVVGGESFNTGDVAVYDGTLQIDGSFTADVYAVPGLANPQICGNGDPQYWVIKFIEGSGPTDATITGTMDVIDPIVFAAGWQAAIRKAIAGTVTVTFFETNDYYFPENGVRFKVATVKDLMDSINPSDYDPYHPFDEAGYFNLGDRNENGTFVWPGIKSESTKVIAFEDGPFPDGNDGDYDDWYCVVDVASGDLAIDSNNDSVTGDPMPHRATDTPDGYADDIQEIQAPGKYIAVQAKDANQVPISGTTFTPLAITVNDFTSGLSKIRLVARSIDNSGTGTVDNSAFVLHTDQTVGDAGATIPVSETSSYLVQTASSPESAGFSGGMFNLVSGSPLTLYVQALKAGRYNVELQIDPQDDGTWTTVDTVRFTALDPNVTCLECTYGLTLSAAGIFWSDNGPLGSSLTMNSQSPGDTRFDLPPQLVLTGNGVAVLQKDKIAVWDYSEGHDETSGILTARRPQEQGDMEQVGTGSDMTFVETLQGTTWTFDAPIPENPTNYFGHLLSQVDAAGTRTDYYYYPGTDQLAATISTVGPAYSYTGDDQNIHSAQRMALNSYDDGQVTGRSESLGYADQDSTGGTLVPGTTDLYWHASKAIGSAGYTRYTSEGSFGNQGDLKLIETRDADGNTTGATYYRYYTAADGAALKHNVQYVLNPASVARAMQAKGYTTYGQLDGLSDAEMQTYADNRLTYESGGSTGRVATNTAQGESTVNYTYQVSNLPDGLNTWSIKRTETRADGSSITTFSNFEGDVLLRDEADASGNHSITFNRYDNYGNVALTAGPSAFSGSGPYYSTTLDDLVGYADSSDSTYLDNTNGLFEVYTYYTDTTATETTAGGVQGWTYQTALAQGESQARLAIGATGGPALQTSTDYRRQTNTVTGVASYFTHSFTEYNDDGDRTTTYDYTFYADSDSLAPLLMTQTTTLPAVALDHHGSGSPTSSRDAYDRFGRVVWSQDAAGSIRYTQYDPATGAAIKQIEDANVSDNPDGRFAWDDWSLLTSLGWTLPSTGENLTTTYAVDSQGRTVRQQDPDGKVTYTVYIDKLQTVTDANGTATILGEVRTYEGWNGSTALLPTRVSREVHWSSADHTQSASYSETFTMTATPSVSGSAPTGTEPISGIQSLSRSFTNSAGQFVRSVEYFSLDNGSGGTLAYTTAPTLGQLAGGNDYLQSETFYDALGRSDASVDPSGTISFTVFDGLGRVSDTWSGSRNSETSATNAAVIAAFRTWLAANPNGLVYSATGVHLYKLSHTVYDAASNTAESWSYVDPAGTAAPLKTYYQYDWRGRQTGTLGPDGVATIDTLDNLGETTRTQTYANATYSAGVVSTSAGNLRAQGESDYDEQGRVYQSRSYCVDPATGTVGNSLPSDTWYDARGNVVKTATGTTGMFQKYAFDSAGRPVASYSGYDASAEDYAGATTVNSSDTIIEQTRTWYYPAEHAVLSATYQRLPSYTTAPQSELTAADSYAAASIGWTDAVGRPTYSVNYGREDTAANAAWTRYLFDATTGELIDTDADGLPDEIENGPGYREPDSSDNYIATLTEYADTAAGSIVDTTDNAGRMSRTQYDLLGRTVRTIQNYVDGTVSETDTACDVTTEYEYDSAGRMVTLIACNAKGDDNNPNTTNVEAQKTKYLYTSPINASWQTRAVYPDSGDDIYQDPVTKDWTINSGSDHTLTSYDLLGRTTLSIDQRGVVHEYSFDAAGRPRADTVSDLGGSGIVDGSILRIGTSYDDAGRVEKITSYSDEDGTAIVNQVQYVYNGWGRVSREYQAHDGAVNLSTTPYVGYNYADGATGGVAKYIRLDSIEYPNGREISYGYGTTGAVDDIMSRLATISDAGGTLAAYKYLGAGTVVKEEYQQPGVALACDPDGDNSLIGLDRFGRVVDQLWADDSWSPVDEYKYTYDRAGNRTARSNELNHDLDESYEYDDLDRLTEWSVDGTQQKTWTLDALGNNLAAGTYNAANEETPTQGSSGYDAAGNMITLRLGSTATFDPWNRLTKVTTGSGENLSIVEQYEYDGTARRIQVFSNFSGSTPGKTIDDYHVGQQTIETDIWIGGQRAGGYQMLWSPRYIDAAILRDTLNTAGSSIVMAERLFYLCDANFNVTGLVKCDQQSQTWQPVERYTYTPYGEATFRAADWCVVGSSSNANTTLYTGREFSLATFLYYYRRRFYDAVLERFVGRDPIGYVDTCSFYCYCGDLPASATDPTGLAPGVGYWHLFAPTTSSSQPRQWFDKMDAFTEHTPYTDAARSWYPEKNKVIDRIHSLGAKNDKEGGSEFWPDTFNARSLTADGRDMYATGGGLFILTALVEDQSVLVKIDEQIKFEYHLNP